jgi:hypothetical protein
MALDTMPPKRSHSIPPKLQRQSTTLHNIKSQNYSLPVNFSIWTLLHGDFFLLLDDPSFVPAKGTYPHIGVV